MTLKALTGQTRETVRGEVHLAHMEMRQGLASARRGAGYLVVGGVYGTLALAVGLLACVSLFAVVTWPYLVPISIVAVTGAMGGVFVVVGMRLCLTAATPSADQCAMRVAPATSRPLSPQAAPRLAPTRS